MDVFRDKVAILTGAASGLGLGLAAELARRGAIAIMLDIDADRLATAGQSMTGRWETRTADVTDLAALEAVFAGIQQKYGRIDYLFNNAGIGGTLPFGEATAAHWKKIIDLNLYGVINGLTAVYTLMKGQGSGHIVNTSSIAGLIPFEGQALYNTTKYAVTGLSLSLERELEKDNIRISVICPGMVRTRIFYKPILGAEAPEERVNIPREAISVERAVEDILRGVGRNRRIIITPGFLKLFYLRYRLFQKY